MHAILREASGWEELGEERRLLPVSCAMVQQLIANAEGVSYRSHTLNVSTPSLSLSHRNERAAISRRILSLARRKDEGGFSEGNRADKDV